MDNPWYPFGLFCDKVEGIEPKWHQHSLTKTWIEEPKRKRSEKPSLTKTWIEEPKGKRSENWNRTWHNSNKWLLHIWLK